MLSAFIKAGVLKTSCRLLAAPSQGSATELDVQQTCLFSALEQESSGLSQRVPALVRRGRGGAFLLNFFWTVLGFSFVFILYFYFLT